MGQLVLKRAAASRLSGEWSDDDYDVLADGIVVGRVMKAAAVGDQAAAGEVAVSIDLRAFGPLPGPDCILLRISERAAVGEHIEVIVIPLVRRTAGRGALEDQRHVRALAARNPRGVNYPG